MKLGISPDQMCEQERKKFWGRVAGVRRRGGAEFPYIPFIILQKIQEAIIRDI